MNQHRLRLRRLGRIDAAAPTSFAAIALIVAAGLIVGCAGSSSESKPAKRPMRPWAVQPSSATDPCALRLQDLAGGLLLYYAQHNELPADLKSLKLPSGEVAQALVCPVSNQPYVYDPRGIPMPDGKSRLVIYDSEPVHGNFRWAVAIGNAQAGQTITPEVIAAPESVFTLQRR